MFSELVLQNSFNAKLYLACYSYSIPYPSVFNCISHHHSSSRCSSCCGPPPPRHFLLHSDSSVLPLPLPRSPSATHSNPPHLFLFASVPLYLEDPAMARPPPRLSALKPPVLLHPPGSPQHCSIHLTRTSASRPPPRCSLHLRTFKAPCALPPAPPCRAVLRR